MTKLVERIAQEFNGVNARLNTKAEIFNNVLEVIQSTSLKMGQKVKTLGYYSPNDGGGTEYNVVPSGTGTVNGGSIINLSGISGQISASFGSEISVKQFGAAPNQTASTNITRILAALNYASGKCKVYLPSGEYIVNDTVEIPSNTFFYGDGAESIIKMHPSVSRGEVTMLTGHRGVKKNNIVIQDMTVDANRSRWSVAGASSKYSRSTPSGASSTRNTNVTQSTIMICNSEKVLLKNVRALDGYKHCIDISAPWYGRGTNSATDYDPEPSTYVTLDGCYTSGAGDDNITTHQCSHLWILNCHSEHPSGVRVPGNSNCLEIDDGSRNVFVDNFHSIGGDCGVQIKGHNDSPAPYNIQLTNGTCFNARYGLEIRHTGWYGTALDPEDVGEVVDEDGNPLQFSGNSVTARNVHVTNWKIIAPRQTVMSGTTRSAQQAIRVRSYSNVSLTNILVSEGVTELGRVYDGYELATTLAAPVVQINSGAEFVKFTNLQILGFAYRSSVFRTYGTLGRGLSLDNYVCIDSGKYPFYSSGTPGSPININNYYISGDWLHDPDSTGLRMSGDNAGNITNGKVVGYSYHGNFPTLGAQRTFDYTGLNNHLILDKGLRITSGRAALADLVAYLAVGESLGSSSSPRDQAVLRVGGTAPSTPINTVTNSTAHRTHWSLSIPDNIVGRIFSFGSGMGIQTSDQSDNTFGTVVSYSDPSFRCSGSNDNQMSLGTASSRWTQVFATSGTINTSDDREKTYLEISEAEKAVANELKVLMKKFKFNSDIERKGEENARIHFGASAQTIKSVFESHGLDAHNYGMFCYDEWENEYEDKVIEESEYDDEGNLVKDEVTEPVLIREAGNRYGVRYEELLCFLMLAD